MTAPLAITGPVAPQVRADVLHIGYPKAASTFIHRYFDAHPEVTTDHNRLADLLLPEARDGSSVVLLDKPVAGKVHVSREESVAESVCIVGDQRVWARNLYIPGAWDNVKHDILVDAGETASRIHRAHPHAKVLILIREQADWLQSAYKYVMSQLPAAQRSFADYCMTPSGIVFLRAGHFDRTITAYADTFGGGRVCVLRFEDIAAAPQRFVAQLCAFVGIAERPLPQRRENDTNVQIARIQRLFPLVDRLPHGMKNRLKPIVARLLPAGRGSILSSREIRSLRDRYAASNTRTERLVAQLSPR
jgi:hypothetical protein